jgi:hypothetical protein
MTDDEIKAILAERDRALLALDLDYARKQFPHASSDEVLLLSMHKARYELPSLPREARLESAEWLRANHYSGYGRPLLPPGQLPE